MNEDEAVGLQNIIQYVGYGGYQNYRIVCPVCGFEYVHPIGVRVTREKEVTEITSKGISIRDATNPGRGVIIEFEYVCENGHHGAITLTFHKGETYLGHEELQQLEHDEWETVWRN